MLWRTLLVALVFFSIGVGAAEVSTQHKDKIVPRMGLGDLNEESFLFPSDRIPAKDIILEEGMLKIKNMKDAILGRPLPSGSMLPWASSNSVTIEKPVRDPAMLKKGDIIVFTVEDKDVPIMHMITDVIVKNKKLFFKTQGINNAEPDAALVPAENVKTVVSGILS